MKHHSQSLTDLSQLTPLPMMIFIVLCLCQFDILSFTARVSLDACDKQFTGFFTLTPV
jgi:hypothetical protein